MILKAAGVCWSERVWSMCESRYGMEECTFDPGATDQQVASSHNLCITVYYHKTLSVVSISPTLYINCRWRSQDSCRHRKPRASTKRPVSQQATNKQTTSIGYRQGYTVIEEHGGRLSHLDQFGERLTHSALCTNR